MAQEPRIWFSVTSATTGNGFGRPQKSLYFDSTGLIGSQHIAGAPNRKIRLSFRSPTQNAEYPLSFQVDTSIFQGPVDLLLHLVKKHEVEVTEIALADVTEKYLQHMDVLKEISINLVGDFVDVASQLIEIKARATLPRNEHEPEDDDLYGVDPRENLVQRLLLYKRFRNANDALVGHRSQWRTRFARIANDAPVDDFSPADQPIQEIELWDLVSAFGRVLRNNRPVVEANVFYDETPIHVYMKRIHQKIVDSGKVSFSQLFEPAMHKSAMVGIFLALLELSRYHNVNARQSDLHSEILIEAADGFTDDLDVSNIDEYDPHKKKLGAGDPGSMVE